MSGGKIDGRRYLNRFSKPAPANHKATRYTRETHPEDWRGFMEYCARDVEVMRTIDRMLPDVNLAYGIRNMERAVWELDQRINRRGVPFDADLALAAEEAVEVDLLRLAERMRALTKGQVISPGQVAALQQYLSVQCGLTLPDLAKATVAQALKTATGLARELLLIRAAASKTNVKKYLAMRQAACSDGRIRGTLQYCGASRTGRWAGRLVQFQNVARPKHKYPQIETAIEAFRLRVAPLVLEDVTEFATSCLRSTVVASPGKHLVVADLSNIEGRVLAWLAGEEWKLQAFADFDKGIGADLYILAYAKAFGVKPEQVTDDQRQIGKVQELALGYQGGVGAFQSMASLYGMALPDDKVSALVAAWRKANPAIVKLWADLERAAKKAIHTHTKKWHRVGKVAFRYVDGYLFLALPSRRVLAYYQPKLTNGVISYLGVNSFTRKVERIDTYSGRIAENLCQAVARDVMANGMLNADAAGLDIVMTVHDEIVCEAPTDRTAEELVEAMTRLPSWADASLPLAAKGYVSARYRK